MCNMKDSFISIRVSEEEKRQIKESAQKGNRSVSNFLLHLFHFYKWTGYEENELTSQKATSQESS